MPDSDKQIPRSSSRAQRSGVDPGRESVAEPHSAKLPGGWGPHHWQSPPSCSHQGVARRSPWQSSSGILRIDTGVYSTGYEYWPSRINSEKSKLESTTGLSLDISPSREPRTVCTGHMCHLAINSIEPPPVLECRKCLVSTGAA